MSARETLYLVSYDITDNKMRRRIANELENYGLRVQYSVFECRLTKTRLRQLYAALLPFCTGETDTIRIYTLCETCAGKLRIIGNPETPKAEEPEGIIII